MVGVVCRGQCAGKRKMPAYALGDKYCSVCACVWTGYAGRHCGCCGRMLRDKPSTRKLRINLRRRLEGARCQK